MDPLTLIMSALAAASGAVGDQAIKDGYAGLKALIVRKFGSQDPALEPALTKMEQKPEVWKEPAAETLKAVGADRDDEVLQRAEALLQLVNQTPDGRNVNIHGQNVAYVGHDLHGNIEFGRSTGQG